MTNYSERRQEPRYQKEVDIIVFSGKHFFRTKTVDLSDGGCRLQQPIPEHFSPENLEVVFSGSEDGTNSFQMLRGALAEGDRTRIALRSHFQARSLI